MSLYKIRSLVKLNLKFKLDDEFIRDGRYSNVASGQTYYDGSDMSLLMCDTNADDLFYGLQDGQVWQSAFRNWVYESGVSLNDAIRIRNKEIPTICSGVYVSGIFRATDPNHPNYDSTAAHHIDWINGRVIFDAPKPVDATVQAVFSYKHIFVGFEHHYNNQLRESYLNSKYVVNPLTSYPLVYPSGKMIPFPAVFIEDYDRRFTNYELGNRSVVAHDRVYFHVWAPDDLTRDDIMDTISFQESKSVNIIDFNLAPLPLSGIYNELSPEYIPYQNLVKDPLIQVPGSVNGTTRVIGYTGYLTNTRFFNDSSYADFERGRVESTMEVYIIMPYSPYGINTGSYNFTGGTEDRT